MIPDKVEIDKAKHIVLLLNNKASKWEDKTQTISGMYRAYYYGRITGYNIYFLKTKGKYFYPYEKVQFLEHKKTINIELLEIIVDGKVYSPLSVDEFEQGYYRIKTHDKTFVSNNVKFQSNEYKRVYEYFHELADYAIATSEDKTPLLYLARNFKRITPNQNSCLFDYLKGVYCSKEYTDNIILPFNFNLSQKNAILNALSYNISVIEGPPGTGKTQTILNLIANIIVNKKTCAIVSNNNSAIKNVYDKLAEKKYSFFAAFMGNRENVDSFFSEYDDSFLTSFVKETHNPLQPKKANRIGKLTPFLDKIHQTENELAQENNELLEIQKEHEHYPKQFSNHSLVPSKRLRSKDFLQLRNRLEKPRNINIFERSIIRLKYKIRAPKIVDESILVKADMLYYEARLKELNTAIAYKQKFLVKNNANDIKKELMELSIQTFDAALNQKYCHMIDEEIDYSRLRMDFSKFIDRFPVILSTAHSLLNSIEKNHLFDYIIIDEASQGDLLSNILAISCAKNIVVIGDSRQLQQIEDQSLVSCSEKLSKKHKIRKCFQYESNSILSSVKNAIPDVPTTLLREHYRCAPDIINFCNKMFYNNELIIMTKNTGNSFNIIKTVPGNHARKNPQGSGLYNEREIDEIGEIIETEKSKDIGIITPFKYQAELIRERYKNQDLEADTVHKFQGREKNTVILSFVVNSLEKSDVETENRLFDFVTNAKLLNVALSRGIEHATLIVSDKVYNSSNNVIKDLLNYIEYLYGNEITKESSITSIFDNLYNEYNKLLLAKYKKKAKQHYTELLMYDLINKLLAKHINITFSMHTRLNLIIKKNDHLTEDERQYINHPWTHVDFYFYNRISKEPLFALEVDGIRHHEQNIKQSVRDAIKDKAFQLISVPLYRFRSNESEEESRLNTILQQYDH